jgi:hypothetical protein
MRAENRGVVTEPQVVRVLKQDLLGRVELVRAGPSLCVRRDVRRGGFPPARWIACALLARERAALRALAGLEGVARLCADGNAGRGTLLRSWIPGSPLSEARELPRDYFERLEELVRALHARGVCHNDLHKEGNVLVGDDGYPALVDFQLASVHPRRTRTFEVRAEEDLRHVWKHRSVYLRALGEPDPLADAPLRRSWLAATWRRLGKPLYNRLARSRALRGPLASGETRRGKDGPWPRWSAPVGPRELRA